MGRYAQKTKLVKKVFGKNSGWARYGILAPSFKSYLCSDCGFAGVVVLNKKLGVTAVASCECVGDSQLSIRVA